MRNMILRKIEKHFFERFFAVFLIEILPESPFIAVLESMKESDLLMSIDWIIPFASFIAIGIAWTTAIGLFYIISVALRWVKAIQ